MQHETCWAKTTPSGRPGISVEQHCRTAGIIAGMLAEQLPRWLKGPMEIRFGVTLAALHDIGKISPGFQGKCSIWLKKSGLMAKEFAGTEFDHAKVSQKTLQEVFVHDRLRFWAAIVGAHHGRLKGDRLPPLCDGGENWIAERHRLIEVLIQEFGELPDRPPASFNCGELWFNAGLIAVADWLASDERSFPPSKVLNRVEIGERARAQLDYIGFRPSVCPPGKTFADLFPFQPNALQKAFTQAVQSPGVYIVEASMGCGKTEAALMAAYNLISSGQATGLYFALPTQATSNRIHERVAAFIDKLDSTSGTQLVHSASWMRKDMALLDGKQYGEERDREGDRDGRNWFASARRALLAPFGVGTVDQALLGVVAAKHFFVRQFGLAGKVVILDEIHSYDLYTGTLLDQLVTSLRELHATVIILSATLTAARRQELMGGRDDDSYRALSDYPLLSARIGNEYIQQPVPFDSPKNIHVLFKDPELLAEEALARAMGGECILWIRNTVNEAQETYRQLCGHNRVGGPEIGLLHARFPQFRREQLENDWLERLGKSTDGRPAHGCVLVSTQVAEQSVDIDADLLVTDIAPTDMLLQRIGRLWRHPRPRPAGCNAPQVWITQPALTVEELPEASAVQIKAAFGKSSRVYAPYVLLHTFSLWYKRPTVTLPNDIRPLIEATYTDPVEEPASWQALHEELKRQRNVLRNAAISESNPWQPGLADEEGVRTRWNAYPTAMLLFIRKLYEWNEKTGARLELLNGERCELRPGVFSFDALQAIHRNIARVPHWCVQGFLSKRKPAWLHRYISNRTITCKVLDERLVLLPGGEETGLTYRQDLGVCMPIGSPKKTTRANDEWEDDDESYDW